MKAVIDTNVLLVANGQHDDASPGCVVECVNRLQGMQREGIVVIDDEYRILGEYQNKTCINPPKGVGDVFLKWLLRNSSSPRVEQVTLDEMADDSQCPSRQTSYLAGGRLQMAELVDYLESQRCRGRVPLPR
jgi:hypothetical protein